jgi:hypothetical protein
MDNQMYRCENTKYFLAFEDNDFKLSFNLRRLIAKLEDKREGWYITKGLVYTSLGELNFCNEEAVISPVEDRPFSISILFSDDVCVTEESMCKGDKNMLEFLKEEREISDFLSNRA